jgi:hypothetical protein
MLARDAAMAKVMLARDAALAAALPPAPDADWRNDPSADERWSAGCDFAMTMLCEMVKVDPAKVSWDAATETLEGDVSAVIGNILTEGLGEDWQDRAPAPDAVEALRTINALDAHPHRAGGYVMDDLKQRLRAEKSVIETKRTFPSEDARDMVLVPIYGPNPLAHEAAAALTALSAEAAALAAQVAKLTRERDEANERARMNSFAGEGYVFMERRAEAAEAKLARLEGALNLIAETTENGTIRRIARAALTEGTPE